MAGYGKTIMLFFIFLNAFILVFNVADLGPGQTDAILEGNSTEGFNGWFFNVHRNATTGDIDGVTAPSTETLLGSIFSILGGLIIGGIAIGTFISQDLATGLRTGVAVFLLSFVILPLATLVSIGTPIEIILIFGVGLTILYMISVLEFIGGVSF